MSVSSRVGDGIATGLAELPPTVVFFEPPCRQSAGFVLDFGGGDEPLDPSPRRNSTGALDLITLLSPPPPPQDGARWWKPTDSMRGSTRPSVTVEQDAHGVLHTLSELQLESLAARFHAVSAGEIRRAHEQFCALSLRSSADGSLVIQRQQLPGLLHLIGLRLDLKMGGKASDPFRFRDVMRILQALRDEEAMMQVPVSPMPAASSAHDRDEPEDLVMYTNPLFNAIKQQRAPGQPGEGVLELSASGAAVLLLPRNTCLDGTAISRQIVEAHIALRCIDSAVGSAGTDTDDGKAKGSTAVEFETLGGAHGLSLDGDMLRIDSSSSLPCAGTTIQVLEREQFFDEECKRHEVLWLAKPLTGVANEGPSAADRATDSTAALGVGAYTLFDQRNSYQEHMAFLYMFTAPPDSPSSGLSQAVQAATKIRLAATTLLSAIMEQRRVGAMTVGGGNIGRRGRRRSLDGLGSALGLGKKLSLPGSGRKGKRNGGDAASTAVEEEEVAAEAALTARLSSFVHGARELQTEAAESVARSLLASGGSSGSSTTRELNSLRSAVSAFIAAAVNEPVLQLLRRAYEHQDIALAAKLAVWANLSDDELRAANLPARPPIEPPSDGDGRGGGGAIPSTYFDLGEASVVLQGLEEGVTPEEQLLTIKRATWAISIRDMPPASSNAGTPRKSKTVKSLPADDLLPLFVELLAKATPPYLFSTICYINFFYVPPAPVSGGGAAAAGGDELSYHATNLRAAAAIIGLRCPWEQRSPIATTMPIAEDDNDHR